MAVAVGIRTVHSKQPEDAVQTERTNPDRAPATDPRFTVTNPSRAFKIVSIMTAVWFTLLGVFGLSEPLLMFLPESSLGDLPSRIGAFEVERMHYLVIGVVAWTIVLSGWTQVHKPASRVAPMLALVAWALGAALFYGLSGTLAEWVTEELIVVVLPVAILALLHPARSQFFSMPRFDGWMLLAAMTAAVPWLGYAVANGMKQFESLATDLHAPEEHWARVALAAILLVVQMFLGASDHGGAILPAWIVSVFSVILGAHSIAFPGSASALAAPFAAAAIAWGIAFAGLASTRRRRLPRSVAELM